jgi:hypothetical protein
MNFGWRKQTRNVAYWQCQQRREMNMNDLLRRRNFFKLAGVGIAATTVSMVAMGLYLRLFQLKLQKHKHRYTLILADLTTQW